LTKSLAKKALPEKSITRDGRRDSYSLGDRAGAKPVGLGCRGLVEPGRPGASDVGHSLGARIQPTIPRQERWPPQRWRPTDPPDMLWHNGAIMTSAVTEAIFWGTSWATNPGDKISGLDTWYAGFGGSNYAKTSDEYTGKNGEVGPMTSYLGHLIDSSAAFGGNRTSAILAEVCRTVSPDKSGNGYYAVYTDLPRGNSNYCAWHSYGTCNGVQVQFAFFWKLDRDPGCDPQSSVASESQGLAALANVSGHELSEARTDPTSGGMV
jgi:hypothetical protein